MLWCRRNKWTYQDYMTQPEWFIKTWQLSLEVEHDYEEWKKEDVKDGSGN